MIVVCNIVFRLTTTRCFPEIFAIKSRNRLMFCGPSFFGGRGEISDRILKVWVTIGHVAKFGDDRPSDFGDYAAKRISTSAAKHISRAAMKNHSISLFAKRAGYQRDKSPPNWLPMVTHTIKGAITSKIKHAIKLKTSPARLAQLLQPSLAFCFSLQPMTAYRPVRRHWLQAKTKCQ